jgi:hypothetical protein
MQRSALTRPASVRLVLVLFLLATSGFTTALHHCVMGGTIRCECDEKGEASKGHKLTDDLNCCRTLLAGGLNHIQTTAAAGEQEHRLPLQVIDASPALPGCDNMLLPAGTLFSISPGGSPPCSQERYLLTATFRI